MWHAVHVDIKSLTALATAFDVPVLRAAVATSSKAICIALPIDFMPIGNSAIIFGSIFLNELYRVQLPVFQPLPCRHYQMLLEFLAPAQKALLAYREANG